MKSLLAVLSFVSSLSMACNYDHLVELVSPDDLPHVERRILNATTNYNFCLDGVENKIEGFDYTMCDRLFESELDQIAEDFNIDLSL